MNGVASLSVLIIILLVLGGLIGAVRELFGTRSSEQGSAKNDHRRASFYRVRDSVLDTRERAFYLELKKQLPTNLHVFPKMRIADMLYVTNGKGYYGQLNRVWRKHVDFLITDFSFHPIAAIELNGASHGREDRQISDATKKEVFAAAGLPLHIVEVGSEFSQEISRLMESIHGLKKA